MSKLSDNVNLNQDFPESSYEQWKKTVEKDLKGIPFEKKLITKTYEGIDLQPIYTKDDIKNIDFVNSKPGFPNFVRGIKPEGFLINGWEINQDLLYPTAEEFNESLRYDLERGQNSVTITPDFASKNACDPDIAKTGEIGKDGISICCLDDLCNALLDIDITKYPVYFNCGFGGFYFVNLFAAYLKKQKIDVNNIKGGFDIDPFAYVVANGNVPVDFDTIFNCLSQVTGWCSKNIPDLKSIGISTLPYHNSGCNAVQELANAISTGVEYLEQMLERNHTIDEIAKRIRFTFGAGSFYFMEVAKLRAARILWFNIIREYGGNEESQKMNIHVNTSFHNQSLYDPYVNMLRTTTETFSAIAGGADSISTNTFDEAFGLPDEFSRRIARNTQIVLKEESHLNQMIDPAGGSYYVEKLTNDLAKSAWNEFREIQKKGGMLKALLEGYPQSEIEKIDYIRKKDFSKRKAILVGTNSYANLKEEKLKFKKPDYEKIKSTRIEQIKKLKSNTKISFDKIKKAFETKPEDLIDSCVEAVLEGATIGEISKVLKTGKEKPVEIIPVKIHRASEPFESLRDKALEYKQKNGTSPKIFLLTMGPVSKHKARADFSRGFFEVGGFDVIYKKGFNDVKAGVDEAFNSGAKIVVICSTDDAYIEIVPKAVKILKEKIIEVKIILAGYPKEQVEKYKHDGIDEFIFLGADVYEVNKKLLDYFL